MQSYARVRIISQFDNFKSSTNSPLSLRKKESKDFNNTKN